MKTKTQTKGTYWSRILTIVTVVSATLACSFIETPVPTTHPTSAPTRTPIPTWTPTPKPTTGEISGQVLDASSSSPIPNANVTTDPPTISVTSNRQGHYVVPEVPPGVYTITATKPGYTSASVSISVTAGKTTTADVHLMVVPTAIPSPQPTQAGLIAHWSFDNCDGTDSSGNGFHGTVFGAPTCVNGVSGKALELDGKDDWFSLQAMPEESYQVFDFSISLWFYTNQDTQQTLWQTSDGSAWGLPGYGISLRSLNDIEAAYRAEYPKKCELHAIGDLEAGTWHHVALVRDTDKKQGLLYVDGDLKDICDDPDPDLFIEPQSYPRVGYGFYAPGDYEKYFSGLVDEVYFHNKALNAADIQTLYRGSKDDGLVAYYPFNGNANDASGNGNHGIVHGATLADDRLGNPDSAYSFDGVDDYIASSSDISLDTTYSVALWFNYTESTESATLFHRGYQGWCWYEPKIHISEASTLKANVSGCSGEGTVGTLEIVPGEWYHVAIVARNGSQAFFVNGEKIASTKHTLRYTFAYKAFIGVSANQNTPVLNYFHGSIDDVRIYNRALSEAEVQALYREGEDTSLVAYYPFNGNADDASGNGNHGIVYGATLTADRFGSPDQAYEFDGMNDYIQVPTDILYHNEFAQSLWIWIPPSQPEASQKHILQTGNGGIYYLPVEKNFRVDIYHFRDGGLKGPGSATRYYYDLSADGLEGTWNHIVLVGFSDNTAKFFVNGAQVPTGDRITDRGVGGDYNATVLGATINTRTGSIDENLAGRIDDVRIYNRALSETEVQALYREGEDTGLVAYYPFNGSANDASGNGNHGIVHGATLTADRFGTPNSAYRFDGNDYIITSLDMTRLWNVGDPIHLSLWIKTTATTGAALAGKPGGGPDFTAVMEPDGSGKVRVRLYGGVNAVSDIPINDDQWHYVCWGTNGTTSYFYIDGKPQSNAPSIGSHNREIAVMFGAAKDPPSNFLNGTIDDVRIYNRALSEAEVQALYEQDG